MKMRYSPMYDWSTSKFWFNFLIWATIWIGIFSFGYYFQETKTNWLKYVGYILMAISLFYFILNLLSIKNRIVWQKYKLENGESALFNNKKDRKFRKKNILDEAVKKNNIEEN